ncbi:hypothetical protein [Nostoc sp.]
MSNLVTDTHALIWYLEDSSRLSPAANQAFEECERRGLEQADLVEILGSSEIVTKIMNSELEITKKQAEALGKFFRVEPSLFIC